MKLANTIYMIYERVGPRSRYLSPVRFFVDRSSAESWVNEDKEHREHMVIVPETVWQMDWK